jgi:pimeloyl-ACP methyl ester carboxylesterase
MRASITTPAGVKVSYSKDGSGKPLLLVHGGFSDDETNWEFVRPLLRERFTLFAIARRGRGETDATDGHQLEDEANDVAALIRAIDEPVFLLGHSYGAHCSLAAAAIVPDRIRKLVLYEPVWPHVISKAWLTRLEALASADEWDDFSVTFFCDVLFVPRKEIDE